MTSSKKVLKYVLSAALAVVLLYFSFRGVDWKEFWKVLAQCRWIYVALAMAAGVCAAVIRSLRWRLLLLPVDPDTSFLSCFDGFNIGKMADFVVPHVGEFVRCGYVHSSKTTYDKALGTVVLERAWDILMLGFLIVLLLVFKWEQFGTFFIEKIVEPAAGGLNISLWWLLAIVAVLGTGALALVIALREKNRLCGKLYGFVKGLLQGAGTCLKMENKWLFLLYTALLWLMFLLMSFFIIKALPQDFGLTIIDALFIMLIGSIAGIVPVPGGFGAFHYLVAIALQTIYSIPFEMGIIFATLSHESQAITMMLIGGISYAHQAFFKKDKLTQ